MVSIATFNRLLIFIVLVCTLATINSMLRSIAPVSYIKHAVLSSMFNTLRYFLYTFREWRLDKGPHFHTEHRLVHMRFPHSHPGGVRRALYHASKCPCLSFTFNLNNKVTSTRKRIPHNDLVMILFLLRKVLHSKAHFWLLLFEKFQTKAGCRCECVCVSGFVWTFANCEYNLEITVRE